VRSFAIIAAVAILGSPMTGCGPQEKPPATPPSKPPLPPRPVNQGPEAERYRQLMNQSPDKAKNAPGATHPQ
jgi:hypothetical protein